MIEIEAKKGRIVVDASEGNVKIALARDDGRIYSRPGAGWVDLTPDQARELADAVINELEQGAS